MVILMMSNHPRKDPIMPAGYLKEVTTRLHHSRLLWATPSAIRQRDHVVENQSYELLPGIASLTPEYARFMRGFVDTLNTEIPVSEDNLGISDHRSVPSDWNNLLNMSGTWMNPLPAPNVDNRLTAAKGFKSRRHEEIANELIDAVFEQWTPRDAYHIARKSSTGFANFDFEEETKLDIVAHTFTLVPEIAAAIRNDKLEELARDTGVVIGYKVSRRRQPNRIVYHEGVLRSKPREAPTFNSLYVEKGRHPTADAILPDFPGFFAMRPRPVYGLSATVNYIMAAFMTPFRSHYLREYSHTFKHTGAEDLERKLRGKLVVGVDAHEFDHQFPSFFFDHVMDRLEDVKIHSDMIELFRHAWRAPAYVPETVVGGGRGGYWTGDPFRKADACMEWGLPSGVAYNPDMGKLFGTFYILCLYDDLLHDVLEVGVKRILKGEHSPYSILNMGDDCLLLTESMAVREKLVDALQGKGHAASPYIELEIESPITFLGMNVSDAGLGTIKVYPNVISSMTNWWTKERAINSAHRKYWGIGYQERKKLFLQCPEGAHAYEIQDRALKKYFKMDVDATIADRASFESRSMSVGTEADMLFLDNPDVIHYKVDVADLSPQIREDNLLGVPTTVIEDRLSAFAL
jgi:hypothetical protein